MNKTFVGVLREFGFKKMPWDKCAKGFKEANYPCYSHPGKNLYAEVYLGDTWPYVWIVGEGIPNKTGGIIQGMYTDDPEKLLTVLSKTKNPES